jgi:hypothetical protein
MYGPSCDTPFPCPPVTIRIAWQPVRGWNSGRGPDIPVTLDEHLTSRESALAPDLILTQDLCDVCAVSYRTVNAAVRVMNLDTRVVSLQPSTIAEILTTIRTVGDLIDAREAAERVCMEAGRRLAELPGPRDDGPGGPRAGLLQPTGTAGRRRSRDSCSRPRRLCDIRCPPRQRDRCGLAPRTVHMSRQPPTGGRCCPARVGGSWQDRQ